MLVFVGTAVVHKANYPCRDPPKSTEGKYLMDTIDISAVLPFLLLVQVYFLVLKSMAICFEVCVANQALSTIKDFRPTQM